MSSDTLHDLFLAGKDAIKATRTEHFGVFSGVFRRSPPSEWDVADRYLRTLLICARRRHWGGEERALGRYHSTEISLGGWGFWISDHDRDQEMKSYARPPAFKTQVRKSSYRDYSWYVRDPDRLTPFIIIIRIRLLTPQVIIPSIPRGAAKICGWNNLCLFGLFTLIGLFKD